MGIIYHGSSTRGLTRLEPHKSTHGNYLYATKYKELAVIFSSRCGDDCTYALYRNNNSEPWTLVERIPEAFNTMFSNSASIYTLDDKTFKDINTGFSELVSNVGANVISEEYIENVYNKIKELEQNGLIKLYTYPNKPKEIPTDNSDLIDKEIRQNKRENKSITRKSFERLILLHPNLMNKINQKLIELNLEPFNNNDLINLFEESILKQAIYPNYEQYLNSIVISISKSYPELKPIFEQKLQFFNLTKQEQLEILFNRLNEYPIKEKYINDERKFSEIGKEILKEIKKGKQR